MYDDRIQTLRPQPKKEEGTKLLCTDTRALQTPLNIHDHLPRPSIVKTKSDSASTLTTQSIHKKDRHSFVNVLQDQCLGGGEPGGGQGPGGRMPMAGTAG